MTGKTVTLCGFQAAQTNFPNSLFNVASTWLFNSVWPKCNRSTKIAVSVVFGLQQVLDMLSYTDFNPGLGLTLPCETFTTKCLFSCTVCQIVQEIHVTTLLQFAFASQPFNFSIPFFFNAQFKVTLVMLMMMTSLKLNNSQSIITLCF